MAYTEADTRAKLMDSILKDSDKEAFGSFGEIKEGCFGLQREIYK